MILDTIILLKICNTLKHLHKSYTSEKYLEFNAGNCNTKCMIKSWICNIHIHRQKFLKFNTENCKTKFMINHKHETFIFTDRIISLSRLLFHSIFHESISFGYPLFFTRYYIYYERPHFYRGIISNSCHKITIIDHLFDLLRFLKLFFSKR